MRAPQRYEVLIAIGGLGSGIHLALEGDHTLGREESRGVYLLDRRDFGKLHIISHYVQTLLGGRVRVVPIGRVGSDSAGESVKRDLQQVGIDLAFVGTEAGAPTLFSVCFAYPDGEGGNLTTLNSASAAVTEDDVAAAEPLFEQFQQRGIAVVAPEVPLPARDALLRLASKHGFLRVGSFVAGELRQRGAAPLLERLDMLAINVDEAAALAGLAPDTGADEIVAAAVALVRSRHEALRVVITAGKWGSWVWDGAALSREAGIATHVVNSAGAGDAHLAALVVALASGVDIREANAFATVVSALKVGRPDTIAWDIDCASVESAAAAFRRPLSPRLREGLGSPLPSALDRTR